MEKDCLQRLLEEGCADAVEFFNCGVDLADLGDFEKAILSWDNAIELEPNYPSAFYNRGNAKTDLGRNAEAILDFDKAIELDPNDAAAFGGRGTAKFELGRKAEAILDFDKAIELDSNDAAAFYNRGLVKSELGSDHEAKLDFQTAVFLSQNHLPPKVAADLVRDFHTHFPAPFLVKKIIAQTPELQTQLFYQNIISENEKQCSALKTWLEWAEIQQNLSEKQKIWFRAVINFYAGDPIEAFQILEPLQNELGDDFFLWYILVWSANEIQYKAYPAILEKAVEVAIEFDETADENSNNDQIFWASRLLVAAEEYFAATDLIEKVLPGNLLLTIALADAFEKSGFGGAPSIDRAKEIIEITGIEPDENIKTVRLPILPDQWFWFEKLEWAAQFYDLEPIINKEFAEGKIYPRFWEMWDASDLETALREHRKAKLEAELQAILEKWEADLQAIFEKNLTEKYAGKAADESKFIPGSEEHQKLFYLKNLTDSQISESLATWIFEGKFPQTVLAQLIEYFYLSKRLPRDEVFYLYFYLSVCKKSGLSDATKDGLQETGKVALENLLKNLATGLSAIPFYSDPLAAGLAVAFTVAVRHFLEQQPGAVNLKYDVFKANFRNFIFEKKESQGDAVFFKDFPLRGFDDFEK